MLEYELIMTVHNEMSLAQQEGYLTEKPDLLCLSQGYYTQGRDSFYVSEYYIL